MPKKSLRASDVKSYVSIVNLASVIPPEMTTYGPSSAESVFSSFVSSSFALVSPGRGLLCVTFSDLSKTPYSQALSPNFTLPMY